MRARWQTLTRGVWGVVHGASHDALGAIMQNAQGDAAREASHLDGNSFLRHCKLQPGVAWILLQASIGSRPGFHDRNRRGTKQWTPIQARSLPASAPPAG